jgi:hypothetical protein
MRQCARDDSLAPCAVDSRTSNWGQRRGENGPFGKSHSGAHIEQLARKVTRQSDRPRLTDDTYVMIVYRFLATRHSFYEKNGSGEICSCILEKNSNRCLANVDPSTGEYLTLP